MRRFVSIGWGLVLFLSAARGDSADPQPAVAENATAMTLVRQALDADLAGRKDDRQALLERALHQSPLYAPARWQSGELLFVDRWLPVREAQQRMAEDRRLKEYRQLREQLDGSAAAHITLARWCRKQQLKDREAFHWSSVLRLQPKNREAIDALQLQEYRGMWLTAEEIALHKRLSQRAEDNLKHWQPILAELRETIDGEDSPQRTAALERLSALGDLSALPALALSLSQASEAYCLATVAALAKIEEQSATDVLTWQALASHHKSARQTAIEALKERPWHAYVPVLMGSLNSPLELTYYVNAMSPGDMKYGYQVLRDGPFSQAAFTYSVNSEVFRARAPRPEFAGRYEAARARQVRAAERTRAVVATQVNTANQVIEWQNDRIYTALEQATGQKQARAPQAWWKWWQEHNELHIPKYKPIYSRHEYHRQELRPRSSSCFIPGTLVWTEAGLEPIEKLRPGDRVLSQDTDTGELALRFIQETTLRPASPTRRVQVKQDTIVTTLGHPFWAIGKGWRMAKELQADDRLHTLEGSAPIALLEDGPDWEAHNLVIEGFGTYFVGKAGLLVRDNHLGEVPNTPIPGYSVVATAVQRGE